MENPRELLAELVATDSVNPDLVPGGAGEAALGAQVAEWLAGRGLEVRTAEVAPGRVNVVGVARGGGGGRSLLLNAHLDTVGYEGMTDPLAPRVEGERMYGRGAYDMKAGLAAIMCAGARAVELGLAGDVIVAAVCDEEYASIGAHAVAEEVWADAAIVAEPTGDHVRLAVAHKGFTWHRIEVSGVAAHGSQPDEGVDAIVHAGRVLGGIEALSADLAARPAHPLLGHGSLHASLIEGGRELSTYPDRCVMQLERRTLPGESREVVEAELQAILDRLAAADPQFRATLLTTLERPPLGTGLDEPIVAACKAALGADIEVVGVPFWADSAVFSAAGIPTVIFGAGGAGAHAAEEWVDLAQLDRVTEALIAVATSFCA